MSGYTHQLVRPRRRETPLIAPSVERHRRVFDRRMLLPICGVSLGILLLSGVPLVLYLWLWAPPPPSRDVSTPAARLFGHWQIMSEQDVPSYDLYFEPVATTGERQGRAAMTDNEGMVFIGTYTLLREDTVKNELSIRKELGPNMVRMVDIVLDPQGLRGRYRYTWFGQPMDQAIHYVDNQTIWSRTPPAVSSSP